MKIKLPTISPAVRISFGLAMFTLSVLLFAELFGLIPNKYHYQLEARKKISESLAVQLSVAATRQDSAFMQGILKSFVERNKDVNAASMNMRNGMTLAQYGEFENKSNVNSTVSTQNYVIVPIYAGDQQWGSVNVEFSDAEVGSFIDRMKDSIYTTILFILGCCYLGYYLILRRTLKILDPTSVVPDRVRHAFNTMSEGVLIIDNKEQILMVNDEFANKVNKDAKSLVGMQISSLNWKNNGNDKGEMPWTVALTSSKKQVDANMSISTLDHGVRTLSVNCAPIIEDKGVTRGVLVTIDDITTVQETKVQLEKAVDDLVSKQSEITRKNIELETLATRDALTGCYNRRAFFDHFDQALQKANADNTPLSCIMADIDHFKNVNDTFGHAVGDEVIQMFADVLNSCQRTDAIIGRYGGEEFCVVLPNTNIDDAQHIAERLRVGLQVAAKQTKDTRLHVTASFGVSGIDSDSDTTIELVNRADQALYISKNNGRNRVSVWGKHESKEKPVDERTDQADITQHTDDDSDELVKLKSTIKVLKQQLEEANECADSSRLTDAVSGLPARTLFEDRLTQSIAMSERMNTITVVTVINIDMFSRINTALGEEVGNSFLREVGNKLKSVIRRSDTVGSLLAPGHASPSLSRLRGDEFALILNGIEDIESISYIVNRLQSSLKGKIEVDDKSFFLNTTIGVSLYPNDASNASTLIDYARTAQRHTKYSSGSTVQFYSKDINDKVIEQMQLEVDLLNALENDEFKMHYQPKLAVATGDVINAEALIRWFHPERGSIPPFKFIPLAEKSGLIIDVGRWILKHVCEQTLQWVKMGVEDLRVSVNVSAIEFNDPDFVQFVERTLRETGLSARHLEIEITESALLKDMQSVSDKIKELRYLGITITLDDFGTGYSSFSYLGNLDFDCVKLDRSFLLEAFANKRSNNLYKSVISMVKNAGLQLVVEGIETKEQFDFVKDLGVDEIQGYIVSKPLDANEITAMISQTTPKQAANS